ncbi:MAG: chemotaxis protein CheA [Gemmatimonadota bacterium]
MDESFDLSALVEEFREEARDQIDRVDAGLLELEREGALEPGTRSDLLRTLHTLKGNAGMLGLSAIRDFVHVMENVLKREEASWPAATSERLFTGAETLRSAVEAAGEERQEEVFANLSAARHRLEEVESAPEPASMDIEADDSVRPPTTGDSVRVPFPKLDTLLAEVGDLMGEARALEERLTDSELRDRAEALRRRTDRLRDSVMGLRLVPIGRVLKRFHGLVRRLARQQDKEGRLVVEGEGTELDKGTADALAEPLLHLVRNAIDHGIRTPAEREAAGKPGHGTIRVRASQEGDRVRVAVEDDGTGLALDEVRERAVESGLIDASARLSDDELAQLVFEPGFSTRTAVSTVSGRGVGLDVVARSVRELRGDVTLERPAEGGTRFVLRLPLTVVIVPSLVFEAGGELLALPATDVAGTLRVDRVERVGPAEVVRADDDLFPLADPHRLFGWPPAARGGFGVLLRRAGQGAVLSADRLVEQRDLVVKAVPEFGRRPPFVSGASVLPGGRVILMLDPTDLFQRINRAGGDRARPA